MSSSFNPPLQIEITLNASQPEFLTGLDVLLRLGLISEAQVRQLSQDYLICPLPETAVVVTATSQTQYDVSQTDSEAIPREADTLTRKRRSLLPQVWQAFKDELSVRWLLFLGLFLVVVSSGVLAATQWERFPAPGQYGLLWTYTLIFWGVGFWAGKQENLQLTSQTLQTITLLLIPMNFWAMDSLWENPWEWLTVAVASVSLAAISFSYNKQRQQLLVFFNFSGLTYLHWGWSFSEFPLIAVYLGTIATAIILGFLPTNVTQPQGETSGPKIGKGLVIYALSVLLVRAIFVVHLPIQQLGLGIGICGWLLGRDKGNRGGEQSQITTHQSPANTQSSLPKILEVIGAILLFLGWLVSVREEFPWQAAAVSGLALQFCAQRLQRHWQRRDLLAIFVIGLQEIFLVWALIPLQFREAANTFFIQLTHSQDFPLSILGVALFPYVIVFVWLTDWLYRQAQPKLARFGEWLTLLLGVVLTLMGSFNTTWRSLNFLLSTATLAFVTYRFLPLRIFLVYLTHILGLLAVSATIDWWFPSLSQLVWASILLVLMVAEWGISTLGQSASNSPFKQSWYRSCWHISFALAFFSYLLLWNQFETFLVTGENQPWVLLWLLTPLTLTEVANRTRGRRRKQAALFSFTALVWLQTLTLWQPGIRLVGLGVAAGLMWFNSCYLRHPATAGIQIFFTLSFIMALLWERTSLPIWNPLSQPNWFLVDGILIIILWLLGIFLRQRPRSVAALYAKAADSWAHTLCVVELVGLTIHSLSSTFQLVSPSWQHPVTSALFGGFIIYRYWQHPNNQAVYGIAWALEICIVEGIMLAGGSTLTLATANIILALFTLWVTNWLLSRQSHLSRLTSLKILPLLFALIGIGWQLGSFTAYTGLFTLGAALTGMGVGYRLRKGKIITYLSLASISLAAYELVIYQLLQASGLSLANSLLILAIATAAFAFIYRLFAWFWRLRHHQTFLNLSLMEIRITAHSHWAIASLLKTIGVVLAGFLRGGKASLNPIVLTVSLILAAYAFIQGRDPDEIPREEKSKLKDLWIYVGLLDIVGTVTIARLIWKQLRGLDPFWTAIVCVVAFVIYNIPWGSWRWTATPWQRAALVLSPLMALVTYEDVSPLSLFLVAVFYVQIGINQNNIRWSYVSVGFIDWMIARWLYEQQLTDILWYASLIGLSLLYIAQVDPVLKTPQQRRNRHYLRVFGSSIIGLAALLFHQDTVLIPSIFSLLAIVTGLGLRIRSFLFVGTITFVLTVFYQLVVLIFEEPFSKWVVGLIAGIIFISIAAIVERRREQIIMVLQNWLSKLNQWE
ncbi:MAG: hypothetical protein AB4426_35150 [Xenococcaceae cyanobacterium]